MDTRQMNVTLDTDVLVTVMLNVLNREGYINNATYIAAKNKIKENEDYVNDEQIQ